MQLRGIHTDVLPCNAQVVSNSYFHASFPQGIPLADSEGIYKKLVEIGLINRDGLVVADPRAINWQQVRNLY